MNEDTETMKVETVEDFSTLSPEQRYVELAKRLVELKDARAELDEFKDEMTGNSDIPWDPVMDEDRTEPEDMRRYEDLITAEDEKWCRVREMVRDALGNEHLWHC